jgi:hypothetical protein
MKRYRVVETKWIGGQRVEYEMDGFNWLTEKLAKSQRNSIALRYPNRVFSIQKEK